MPSGLLSQHFKDNRMGCSRTASKIGQLALVFFPLFNYRWPKSVAPIHFIAFDSVDHCILTERLRQWVVRLWERPGLVLLSLWKEFLSHLVGLKLLLCPVVCLRVLYRAAYYLPCICFPWVTLSANSKVFPIIVTQMISSSMYLWTGNDHLCFCFIKRMTGLL